MKNSIVLFLFLLGSISFAQNSQEKEVEKIIESMFQHVFSELDETKIGTYFTSDFILFEDGEIMKEAEVLDGILKLQSQFFTEENKDKNFERINSFEFMKTFVKDDLAWVSYKNSAVFKMNGAEIAHIKWLESAQLIKQSGNWKIQFLHSTIEK